MSYLTKQPTGKKTPPTQPIPGREKDMQRNNGGGFVFTADSFARLERFLILGSEGGTYYVGEGDLTKQNVDNVRACVAADGLRAVNLIVDISDKGRAPKNDPAIYALALAASFGGSAAVREYALAVLPKVCRIGTHLFQFCSFIDTMRGWGPALRRAVSDWYLAKTPDQLAYQILKYQNREGWSHKDVIKLAHPKADLRVEHSLLLRYALRGSDDKIIPDQGVVTGYELAKRTTDSKDVAALIKQFGLTREMIPTEHQKSPEVWEALLEKMPLHAMIRTLGRMGASGLLAPLSDASRFVAGRLASEVNLRKSRVHPIQLLSAILTYGQGHGTKGSLTWTVVPQITDALNDAFYKAFEFVEPTNKRFYMGVDVSGSMNCGQVAGVAGLTPNMGAAAMAMLIARTEPNYFIGGFSHRFVDLGISKADRLDQAMQKAQRDFGGTDCAVAIKHALTHQTPVDAFVIITDGETWAGDQYASHAIVEYRQKMAVDAKLIVINMVSNRTRVGDPQDQGSLDVVGFDASVPAVIAGFLGVEKNDEAEKEPE